MKTEKRITHPDYRSLLPNGKVSYTQEGLRFYNELFRKHGIPLPLPEARADYEAAMWRILDAQLPEILEELRTDMPSMQAGEREYTEAFLAGDTTRKAEIAGRLSAAVEEAKAVAAKGANVVSLAFARLTR